MLRKSLQKTSQFLYFSRNLQKFTTQLVYQFDRVNEKSTLQQFVYGNCSDTEKKSINLLTGPPNCGKTYLLKQIIQDPKIHIDLRTIPLSNIEELANSIINQCSEFQTNKDEKIQTKSEVSLGIQAFGFGVTPKYSRTFEEKKLQLQELQRLALQNLNSCIKSYVQRKKLKDSGNKDTQTGKKFVLFIDELGALKILKKDNDIDFVKDFFRSLIELSKQENELSVVFGTTNCFIETMLENFGMYSNFYQNIYIGQLSELEAKKFMNKQLQMSENHAGIVYRFVGGHVYDICKIIQKLPKNYTTDDVIKNCLFEFEFAKGVLGHAHYKDYPILKEYWEKLYELKGQYYEIINKQEEEKINQLIAKNYLFKGDSPYISNDFIKKPEGSFITFNRPVERWAAARLLQKYKSDDALLKEVLK